MAMQHRIERLLNEGETVGPRIFAVTFTRHAAAQLKDDLTGLDAHGAELINASTLHAYAFRMLRQQGAIEAIGRIARPCFDFELVPFFYDIANNFGGIKQPFCMILQTKNRGAMFGLVGSHTLKYSCPIMQSMSKHMCISFTPWHEFTIVPNESIPI